MRLFLTVLIISLAFLSGIGIILGWRWWQTQQLHQAKLQAEKQRQTQTASTTPSPALHVYNSNPPRQSLSGQVASLSGQVTIDPRLLPEPVPLTADSPVLEDESITTTEGSLTVLFPASLAIGIEADTTVAFSSTNPAHFLVKLDQGTLTLQTDPNTSSLSVRSLHGLFTLTNGQATITTEPDEKLITISVINGTMQVGYINVDNETQMETILAGQSAEFDDTKRVLTVQ